MAGARLASSPAPARIWPKESAALRCSMESDPHRIPFPRRRSVLYVDIDIHHGDGVEEAFYTTDRWGGQNFLILAEQSVF